MKLKKLKRNHELLEELSEATGLSVNGIVNNINHLRRVLKLELKA